MLLIKLIARVEHDALQTGLKSSDGFKLTACIIVNLFTNYSRTVDHSLKSITHSGTVDLIVARFRLLWSLAMGLS